eukprot:1158735-Pelagomonas_calceolata.AAC.2
MRLIHPLLRFKNLAGLLLLWSNTECWFMLNLQALEPHPGMGATAFCVLVQHPQAQSFPRKDFGSQNACCAQGCRLVRAKQEKLRRFQPQTAINTFYTFSLALQSMSCSEDAAPVAGPPHIEMMLMAHVCLAT